MNNRENPERVKTNPLPHIVLEPSAHRKICLLHKATGMSRKSLLSQMIYRFSDALLSQLGFTETQKGK